MGQIVVPAAARSVITPVAQTTFQVGTYAPLNDTFTKVVDLNDHASFWLVKVGLPQPEKVYARTSTIRAAGERITNWNYKNRHITVTLQLLYQSGTTALLQAVRSLLAAIENPPYRLAFAPPNAGVLTYADVVAVKHTIPSEAKIILAKAISNITIDFECAPGFSGDRITLQNLVVNPGFEAPSGPGVGVFSDSFTNANAYTASGTAPTVNANVMTLPSGTLVTFGSPAWGAINQWQVRFQWLSGGTYNFYFHFADGNNNLYAAISQTSLVVAHYIGGVNHVLASTTLALVSGSWLWLTLTQFPSAPGTQPDVQVVLSSDSSGAKGATANTLGPVATYDGVTALSGKAGFYAAGAAMQVGGAFAGVHTLSLFGPGGWTFNGANGGTSIGSGGWEQATSNTYSGGAVTSYGAARLDLPPAGSVNAYWESYSGGAPAGTSAIPASTGQSIQASAYVKSSGLSAGATLQLQLREWDSNGALLRATALQLLTGNQAAWVKLSGTATLGAATAYVSALVQVIETTAGASANGTVWIDNIQVWNQTTTGQTVMPYCELRFPQSPAQLLLTGLQGDMSAPAFLDVGIYVPSSTGSTIRFVYALGSRAAPQAAAQLVYTPQSGSATSEAYILSSSAYGGYYVAGTGSSLNVGSDLMASTVAALVGAFHVFAQVYPNDTHYTSQTIQLVFANERLSNNVNGTLYGSYTGAQLALGAAASQWLWADTGALMQPIAPSLAREDLTQKWLELNVNAKVSVIPSASAAFYHGALALMPVDGSFVSAQLSSGGMTQQWLWVYADPPQTAIGAGAIDAGWRYSIESTPLPNPAHAGGGPAVGNYASIQPLADPYWILNPTNTGGNGGVPIAQITALLADTTNGAVYAVHHEVQYTPLYLYPREQ